MKRIIYSLCAFFVVFILFRAIGVFVVNVLLKPTGGVVTAESILGWSWVLPILLAGCAFWFVWLIMEGDGRGGN